MARGGVGRRAPLMVGGRGGAACALRAGGYACCREPAGGWCCASRAALVGQQRAGWRQVGGRWEAGGRQVGGRWEARRQQKPPFCAQHPAKPKPLVHLRPGVRPRPPTPAAPMRPVCCSRACALANTRALPPPRHPPQVCRHRRRLHGAGRDGTGTCAYTASYTASWPCGASSSCDADVTGPL